MSSMNKLRGRIIENGLTVEKVATQIGISRSSMFRKIAENGQSFTIQEATAIIRLLNLSMDDVETIFFS